MGTEEGKGEQGATPLLCPMLLPQVPAHPHPSLSLLQVSLPLGLPPAVMAGDQPQKGGHRELGRTLIFCLQELLMTDFGGAEFLAFSTEPSPMGSRGSSEGMARLHPWSAGVSTTTLPLGCAGGSGTQATLRVVTDVGGLCCDSRALPDRTNMGPGLGEASISPPTAQDLGPSLHPGQQSQRPCLPLLLRAYSSAGLPFSYLPPPLGPAQACL